MSQSRKKILVIGLVVLAALLTLVLLSESDSGSANSVSKTTIKKVVVNTTDTTSGSANGTLAARVYRPQGKWCPTVHLCFTTIKWRKYGSYSASGWGTIKACPPSVSKSHCSTFQGTINLYNITTRCGQPEFNELKIKAKGEKFVFGLDPECRIYTGNSGAFLGQQYAGAVAYAQKVKIVTCNIKVHHQQMLTSVKGISCQDAADDLIASDIQPTFTTPLGFLCQPIEGSQYGADYRCVRDEQAYRFKFGY